MTNSIAEIKLNYQPRKLKPVTKITHSEKAYEVLLNHWDKGILELQEQFRILLLNQAHEALGLYTLSKGGLSFTPVDLRIMFGVILKSGATGFISSHNHPTGRLTASQADLDIHKKIKKIAGFHNLNYLDNLIITPNSYYSFQDEGYY